MAWRVLITGATGFIGSHLASRLHQAGYQLRALVRSSSSTRFLKDLPVEYVTGNFDDPDSLAGAVRECDYIYHVAGVVAAKREADFFRANQTATANLMDVVKQYNPDLKRFVHVSSLTAIGPAPDEHHPVTEDSPPHPITTYGRSKAAAEREVLARKDDLPITIVRPPAVYGPRDTATLSFFKAASKGFIPLIGFDRKLVSLVHVRDLVNGFALAGESQQALGEAYNISSDEFYTWIQIGDVTARVLGRNKTRRIRTPHLAVAAVAGISGFIGKFQKKPPVLDFEKHRDIIAPFWICTVDKAREHFGYRQQVSLDEGITETIAWYRQQKWI